MCDEEKHVGNNEINRGKRMIIEESMFTEFKDFPRVTIFAYDI